MIAILLLTCQIEFEQADTRKAVTKFVENTTRQGRSVEEMWVEQCVAKKEAGL